MTTFAYVGDYLDRTDVLRRIESGESVRSIARSVSLSDSDVSRWLRDTPENAELYAKAKEDSAESWMDRGLEVLESALPKDSDIDPAAARAYDQACRMRAALRNPAYREKSDVHVDMRVRKAPDLSDDELAAIAAGGEAGSA